MELVSRLWFSPTASKKIRSLAPVLKALPVVHERYTSAEPGDDISYWYGERSQVGFLEAAAYLAGNTAVEEYSIPKSKAGGRGDLYIRTSYKATFEFEAKARRDVNLRSPEKGAKAIGSGLRQAEQDARAHLRDGHYRVGICFAGPWINERWSGGYREGWNQIISELRPRCDALLSVSLKEPLHRDNRFYPGLFLALKGID